MPPDRNQVAGILQEIARLIDTGGKDPDRSRSFQRAARTLETMPGTLDSVMVAGGLRELPGIGPVTGAAIREIYREGRSALVGELRAGIPAGILEILKVPGLGPSRVRLLHLRLGVRTLEELEMACVEDRLAGLAGFGGGDRENILRGIEQVRGYRGKLVLPEADRRIAELISRLRSHRLASRAEPAGAARRREAVVSELKIVAEVTWPDGPGAIRELLGKLPGITPIPADAVGEIQWQFADGVPARLEAVSPAQYPFRLLRETGSPEHVRLLTEWAVETGFRIDDDGLIRATERISIATEEEIYAALGLRFIPPEIRQGGDEVRLAREGRLPALIESDDLRGTFHVHTVWSDGAATIEEMAAEAEEFGFEYLGVSDHSRRASIANGLSPERLVRQMEEIDRWNRQGNRIRILKGSEVDILEAGSLDFDDALLARLDFVIASIHERFGMDPQRMTGRLLRALDNPHLTILGHPTGRLLLERQPFGFEMDAVFRRAAERGVKVELNGSPRRLDPEPEMCRRAAGLGARLSIDPDAHHRGGVADVRYGIDQARRAWLTREDVWNCLPLEKIIKKLGT